MKHKNNKTINIENAKRNMKHEHFLNHKNNE